MLFSLFKIYKRENYDDFKAFIPTLCNYCKSDSFREIKIGYKILNLIFEEEAEKYCNNKELLEIEKILIEIIKETKNIFSALKCIIIFENFIKKVNYMYDKFKDMDYIIKIYQSLIKYQNNYDLLDFEDKNKNYIINCIGTLIEYT